MSKGLKILNGISKWVRESIGPEAENRGQEKTDESDETDEDEDNESATKNDSPVCCSAASNTDLTVLES